MGNQGSADRNEGNAKRKQITMKPTAGMLEGAWKSSDGGYLMINDSERGISFGRGECLPYRVEEFSAEHGGLYFKTQFEEHIFLKSRMSKGAEWIELQCGDSKTSVFKSDACTFRRCPELDPDGSVNATLADANLDENFSDERFKINSRWDRFYVHQFQSIKNTTMMDTCWSQPLQRGGRPYFCPSGWRRFALQVDMKTWEDCPIVYHGTAAKFVDKIVSVGFKAHQCQHDEPFAYFTPSIIYASHPRYAKVLVKDGMYTQVVLEVRLKEHAIAQVKGETMRVNDRLTIDPNFPNNKDLEFLVRPRGENYVTKGSGALVTAVMLRVLPFDPAKLPCSTWWGLWRARKTLQEEYYNPPAEKPEMYYNPPAYNSRKSPHTE